MEVLQGKRPRVPADCPTDFKDMMERCWNEQPAKRPNMEEVVQFFERSIAECKEVASPPPSPPSPADEEKT